MAEVERSADLGVYCRRIGYEAAHKPTLAVLRDLVRLHTRAIDDLRSPEGGIGATFGLPAAGEKSSGRRGPVGIHLEKGRPRAAPDTGIALDKGPGGFAVETLAL